MNGKIGTGFALAWLAAVGLVMAAFMALNAWMEKPSLARPTAVATQAASAVGITETASPTASPVPTPPPVSAPPSLAMSLPTTVSSDPVTGLDLDHLAAAVHLREPAMGASKQVWAAELPVAQSLLQRPCDCDQRNWLKHYVKTAQDAISGSEDYVPSIELLATLRRSDQDITLSSQAPH